MHFRPGRVWKFSCLVLGLGLIVSFQNFTLLPIDRLKLRRLEASIPSAYAAGGDIRKIAPRRPASMDQPVIAIPQEGRDLGSVSQAWFTRQARLLTNGEDERILKDVNRSLQKSFANEKVTTFEDSQSSTEVVDDRAIMPSVRLTAFNRIQFGAEDSSRLSCLVNGSSVQLDLSHSVTEFMNLNVHHETSTNSNTLQLQYVW